MSHKHMMVDIEALGTGRDAAIVSVGAVRFDFVKPLQLGLPGGEFYQVVDLVRSKSPGEIDPATLMWWLKQSEDARKELTSDKAVNLRQVLEAFSEFAAGGETMWSNGPLFDERIMREAYHRHAMKFPIHYRGSRCCRTYYALGAELKVKFKSVEELGLLKHHALDDAIVQAHHMRQVHEALLAQGRMVT